MDAFALKLNDFETFDKLIDGMVYYFYHDGIFNSPIYEPKTLAEYQFCHYAYWMTIYSKDLADKPEINVSSDLAGIRGIRNYKCFACAVKYTDIVA